MKRTANSLEILLVIIVLMVVPIYWLSLGNQFEEKSLVEGRFLTIFPQFEKTRIRIAATKLFDLEFMEAHDVLIGQIKDRNYQSGMELAAADQFPFRVFWIKSARFMDRASIRLAYLFLKDPAIPADNKSQLYIMRDETFFIRGIYWYSPSKEKKVEQQIEKYETLIKQYPEINFYIFYHELMAESRLDPRLGYIKDQDGGRTYEYFKSRLPEDLHVGELPLETTEDFTKYYYLTDHHWNIRGAWQAYENIYDLLSIHYPDISPKLQVLEFKTYPDLLFLGTYYRDSLYPIEPEPFEIARINAPTCTIRNDKEEITNYNQNEAYWNGQYDREPSASQYGNYFGTVEPFLEYQCQNDSSRNILVIGNSYKTALQPWIAAHYQHAFFVTLSYYDDFSLGAFLIDHPVDDVLFIGDHIVLSNPDWMITP